MVLFTEKNMVHFFGLYCETLLREEYSDKSNNTK